MCKREREVYPHGKDGVSEPGAYDISMADVEWIHWWSSDLTMDVEYCIWASSSEYVWVFRRRCQGLQISSW
ncbi:unnamed protein product [Prunus armeniaca]